MPACVLDLRKLALFCCLFPLLFSLGACSRGGGPSAGPTPATVSFTATPTPGDSLEIGFTDTSRGVSGARSWDPGDGSPALSGATASHTYPGGGSYVAVLTITDAAGNSNSGAQRVTVYAQPAADFTASASPADPQALEFTGATADVYGAPLGGVAPDPSISSWHWDLGDGSSASGRRVSHRYSQPGDYPVTLTTQGPAGSSNETRTVAVGGGAPVAGFLAQDDGQDPQRIQFTNTTTGSVTSQSWDFGDGNSSADANPQHRYAAGGQYAVTLAVSNGASTVRRSDTLTVGHLAPQPDIRTTPGTGFSVDFRGSDPATITNWEWDFGDGTAATGRSASHTYGTAGSYTVSLTTTGPGGQGTTTARVNLGISVPGIDFSSRESGVYEITLTPQPSGSADTLLVEFGDGESELLTSASVTSPGFADVTHQYRAAGAFPVTMRLTGPAGTVTRTRTVTVDDPLLSPSINLNSGATVLDYDLAGSAAGTVINWQWDLGDGTTASGQTVSHSYAQPGSYTVVLTVTGTGGSETISRQITTGQVNLLATIAVSAAAGSAPFTVDFRGAAQGAANVRFDWDFGDGDMGSGTAISHTYTQSGSYTASLNATDLDTPGRTSTATVSVDSNAIVPEARIRAAGLRGETPFTLYAEDDSLGTITGWRWDFGDGSAPLTTSSRQTASQQTHVYSSPGRYTLELEVSGPLPSPNDRDTRQLEVMVTPPATAGLQAGIVAQPVRGPGPLSVDFNNASTGTYNRLQWEFGDGTTSDQSNPTHTYTASGEYRVRLTLLGPAPSTFPLATATEVISVNAPPLPGLGPPEDGSQGGIASTPAPRPDPGTGGSRPGGGPGNPLPGSIDARPGAAWFQASPLRYQPTAGMRFNQNYGLQQATSAANLSQPIACGGPCTNEACGLTLPSAHGSDSLQMLNSAMVTTTGNIAYLAVTEQRRIGSAADAPRQYSTTISTLDVGGNLRITDRTVLEPRSFLDKLSPSLPSSSQYFDEDRSSFLMDDLLLLDSGTLVVLGRIRAHYDFGSNTTQIDERPGLFAFDPATGHLLWSLLGEWNQPQPQEAMELRASFAGDRILFWVMTSRSFRATDWDGVLYDGRIPNNGDHLAARKLDDRINSLDLVDYAVGPDDNVYLVSREESPLACLNETQDSYQLRIYNNSLTRQLTSPVKLTLDYNPGRRASRATPRLNVVRNLQVERDGQGVRVISRAGVWPANKQQCSEYRGSGAHLHPRFPGSQCPAGIVRDFCCDDPGVAAQFGTVCAGIQDKGACPCQGLDPRSNYCPRRATPQGVCEQPATQQAVEHIAFNTVGQGLQHQPSRQRVIAMDEDPWWANASSVAASFGHSFAISSDGRGHLVHGNRVINLDAPQNRDIELPRTRGSRSYGPLLTDRGNPPRTLDGSQGGFSVLTLESSLGLNVETARAEPQYGSGQVLIPAGGGKLVGISGSSARGGIAVRLYAPSSTWAAPLFSDHARPVPPVALCPDTATSCQPYVLFNSVHTEIEPGFSRCRGWDDPECQAKFLDWWEYRTGSSRSRNIPGLRSRVLGRVTGQVLPTSTTHILVPSPRLLPDPVPLGYIQPRCGQVESQVLDTRNVCVDYDHARGRCRRTELQERLGFRCVDQNEQLLPVVNAGNLGSRGWQRLQARPTPSSCGEVGLAIPVLTVTHPGQVFRTTATRQGDSFRVRADVPSSSDITLKVVAGDAEFANGTQELSVSAAQRAETVLSRKTDATAIIQADWDDPNNYYADDRQRLAVTFAREGPACKLENNRFRACTVRHPGPVLALADQPARHVPATVAEDVDLATRSYWPTELDIEVPAIDFPLVIARHHIPPRQPSTPPADPNYNPLNEGAELGPGWRLNLIQWLLPITPDSNASALEPAGGGFDMALHAGGRIERFEFSTIGAGGVDYGTDSIYRYDDSDGQLKLQSVPASIAVFKSPPGYEGTLRAYTINPPAGARASDHHPFFHPDRDDVGPDEQRFFILTDKGGLMRVFNCKGQLLRMISPRYHEMEFLYAGPEDHNTGLPVLSGVVDTNGRLSTINWMLKPSGPKIREIILPLGRRIFFSYRETARGASRLASINKDYDAREPLSTSPNPSPIDPAVSLRHGYGYTSDNLIKYRYIRQGRRQVVVLRNRYQGQELVAQETGAGEDNAANRRTRDGGVTRIAYSQTGATVTDRNGIATHYELAPLRSTDSARVVISQALSAEVYNDDWRNPGASLQQLSTRYEHNAAGYLTGLDPPGALDITWNLNGRGDITNRTEEAGTEKREWDWDYLYDGPCMTRQTEEDPADRPTVTHYHRRDLNHPGLACHVQRVVLPSTTDPDGTRHQYERRFEYIGDAATTSASDRVLRGMVSRTVYATVGAATPIQQTQVDYWNTSGGAAAIAGRTAHTRLGLPRQTSTSGQIDSACSGNVTPRHEVLQDYDYRGNLTLHREWVIDSSSAGSAPLSAVDASITRNVYDQADRLYSSNVNGVLSEYAYNDRGQLTEVSRESRDIFDGASLKYPVSNVTNRKSVTRYLYLHSGQRYATLEGFRTGATDPVFNSFSYSARDGEGREFLRVSPAGGIGDTRRRQLITALLSACPNQRTASSGPSCAVKAYADMGLSSLNLDPSTVRQSGAPLRFENFEFTGDGLLASHRIHDGTAAVAPQTGGMLLRHFYDSARNPRLEENGVRVAGKPVRLHSEYNGFSERDSAALLDPAGCKSGAGDYTEVWKEVFENRDELGRPQRHRLIGDNGAVASVAATVLDSSACDTSTELQRRDISYDEIGRITGETQFVHVLSAPTSTQQVSTESTYGPLGHLKSVKSGQLVNRQYAEYTGAVCAIDVATAGGNVLKRIRHTLDGLQRITASTVEHLDDSGHGLGEPRQSMTLAYNEQGLRREVRDGIGRATRFHYDALGRLRVEEAFNDLDDQIRQREIQYSVMGDPVNDMTRTDDGRRGTWRVYVANHLVEETTTMDGAWRARRRFVLDHMGRALRIEPHGLDTEVVERELDEAGRTLRETLKVDGQQRLRKTFSYDALGSVTRLAAVDLSTPRISPWNETKRFRYNGLGHMTLAQNEISDPLSSSPSRNGVVSNAWMARNSRGQITEEGIKLFDRGTRVFDDTHTISAQYSSWGQITRLQYDDSLNRRNRPDLRYSYDDGRRLNSIRGDSGMVMDRFEFAFSGDYLKRRRWFATGGIQKHSSVFSYDRLLNRYQVTHELDRVRLENRAWYRNSQPAWKRTVSSRFDGGNWIANADDKLLDFPGTRCNGAVGAIVQGSNRRAVAELTADSCLQERDLLRVMGSAGWDMVRQTGAVGSSFSGTVHDSLGRQTGSTSISYAGPPANKAAPSITRRWTNYWEGRVAREQSVEIGAKVNSSVFTGDSYEWAVRAITKHQHAYEGLPLFSGISCGNTVAGIHTPAIRRHCGTYEYRFVEPPVSRFPGPEKPFDALNLVGDWPLAELKRDQLDGQLATPPTAPPGPDRARYQQEYSLLGGPRQLSDDITHNDKYQVEYDLFGRQVIVRDNQYLGPVSGASRQATHRLLYDARDRLIYEDYDSLRLTGDDHTYAPTAYGYFGTSLVREHSLHPVSSEPSDRVYVYGPRGSMIYTSRMGTIWNPNFQPPIAHLPLEDVDGSPLSMYYQSGADRGYHQVSGEIRNSKVRFYIKGPSTLAGVPAISEPYRQLTARMRASSFEGMVYSLDSGFHRARTASWRTNQWVAQEITVNEWLRQAQIARYTAYAAIAAPVVVVAAAFAPPALMLGASLGLGAIQGYHLAGHVADEGWTDQNMAEAGWIGFGAAADVATVGGFRYATLARIGSNMDYMQLAYHIPPIVGALGDNCFVAGTLVWTEAGLRPIEDIAVGDQVWTLDLDTGDQALKPVLQSFTNRASHLVEMQLDGEQLQLTVEHPVWVQGQGWTAAGQVTSGDILRTAGGDVVPSLSRVDPGAHVDTFNIDVEGNDNFFVGHRKLLVHNTSGGRIISKIGPRPAGAAAASVSGAVSRLRAVRAELGEGVIRAHRLGIVRLRSGHHTGIFAHPERMQRVWDQGRLAPGMPRMTPEDVQAIMALHSKSQFRRSFLGNFRAGHHHEMLMVSNAPTLYRYGFRVAEIRDALTLPTSGLMVTARGRHGQRIIGPHTGSSAGSIGHRDLHRVLSQAQNKWHMEAIAISFHRRRFFSNPETVRAGILRQFPHPP